MIVIPTLVTANVSTIFFNDICSGWLAFSTYLIWILDFGKTVTLVKQLFLKSGSVP